MLPALFFLLATVCSPADNACVGVQSEPVGPEAVCKERGNQWAEWMRLRGYLVFWTCVEFDGEGV